MKFSLFSFESLRTANGGSGARPAMGSAMRAPMPVVDPRMAGIVRMVQELNGRQTRAYDASITTGFNADFRGTYGSANTEIIGGDFTGRARSRTLAKDTPQGKAIVRTYQNNVVGDDPFKLDMRFGKWESKEKPEDGSQKSEVGTGIRGADPEGSHRGGDERFIEDAAVNRAIETEWEIFGQPENFTIKGDMSRMEAFRIMEASVVRDGFVLCRHHRKFPFSADLYAVELLECDRLQSQFQGKSPQGNPIRFSIEFDKTWNRKVAFWILAQHPGDSTGQSMLGGLGGGAYQGSGNPTQNFRVQIMAADVIAFHNLRDRAEQDVGFTELDASVQSLWRLFQYEKALTYAAIASCCKPFWIKKEFPTGMSYTATADELASLMEGGAGSGVRGEVAGGDQVESVAQGQQGLRQRMSTEVPGATLEMEYGHSLMQTDPKFPIEAAHEFRQDNQRDIAVASGVSYQDVSGDFQNLGFAAALMCQTPKQDYCKIRQRNFIDCVVRAIFREKLRAGILAGTYEEKYGVHLDIAKLEEYVQAAKFKGKRWAFVNPLVQAQTLIIMLEAGIMAPQQVQDQLPDGVSIEQLYTMIAEAKAEQEKHGLNFEDEDVTRPVIDKGQPEATEAPPQESNAPAKKKASNPVRETSNIERRNGKRNGARIKPEVMALIDQQGDGLTTNGH